MKFTRLCLIAALVGTVAVIGCSEDAQGTGGSGGSAGSGGTAGSGGGGTGGTPAEDCADADLVCAACEVDTAEWERCIGAVFICNEFFEPSECEGCIENSQPARDCDGAGGTGGAGGAGGSGGTAGGGGTGGTPAEDCADSGLLCAACEVDTAEWEQCLGAVFLCNEVFDPSECEGCVDSLQPGSDCDGSGGTGGAGGTGGTGGTAGSGGTSGEIPGCNASLCATDQARRDRCEEFIPQCIAVCEGTVNPCGPDECLATALVFICNEQ